MTSKIKKRLFGFGLYSVACLSLFAQKGGRAATPVYLDENKAIEQRVEDALSRMTLEEKVAMVHAQSNFSSAGCPRLGIPELWMSDGPHGVRAEVLWGNFDWANWTTDSCTAFPALTCLAASFNPDMAYAYGEAIGAVRSDLQVEHSVGETGVLGERDAHRGIFGQDHDAVMVAA